MDELWHKNNKLDYILDSFNNQDMYQKMYKRLSYNVKLTEDTLKHYKTNVKQTPEIKKCIKVTTANLKKYKVALKTFADSFGTLLKANTNETYMK